MHYQSMFSSLMALPNITILIYMNSSNKLTDSAMALTRKRKIKSVEASQTAPKCSTSPKLAAALHSHSKEESEEIDASSAFISHLGACLSAEQVRELRSNGWQKTALQPALAQSVFECRMWTTSLPPAMSHLPYKQTVIDHLGGVNEFETGCAQVLAGYHDLYYTLLDHSDKDEQLRRMYTAHVISHMQFTRDIVVQHNQQLRQMAEALPGQTITAPPAFRDQGLTRPKVLVLLPFRSRALQFVNRVIRLMFGNNSSVDRQFVTNRKKFVRKFEADANEADSKRTLSDDYKRVFTGNLDDDFLIGVALARRSLKLFTELYDSDLLIASPLGLRRYLGDADDVEHDPDLLASIELLIVDECDVLLMQNWAHVLHIMQFMNKQPVKDHHADITRVRMWTLDGHAAEYRQTVVLSRLACAQQRALFTQHCTNYKGLVSVNNLLHTGCLQQLPLALRHTYHRFVCANALEQADARFHYFSSTILPRLINQPFVLLFVSDYFDFVRVRNHLKRECVSAVFCCEYTSGKKVAAARGMFYSGEKHMLVMTERFHYFKRYIVKGAEQLVMYELPLQAAWLYPELCGLLQHPSSRNESGAQPSVTVLFSVYDTHRLQAVLGTQAANQLCSADKTKHVILNQLL